MESITIYTSFRDTRFFKRYIKFIYYNMYRPLTLLGLKSAKLAEKASPPPRPLTPVDDPENGSELPNGSFGNAPAPNGSGFFGFDGLDIGDLPLGGAGRGGGAFFCLGGNAGRGDSERDFAGGEGAKGSLPNKSPLGFCNARNNGKFYKY